MKKKLLTTIIAVTMSLLITACSSSLPKYTSQEAYDIGKEAYDAMDAFCSGSMNRDTCIDKLEDFEEQLREINANHEKDGNSDDYLNDDSICLDVGLALSGFRLMDLDESYEIEDAKNKLASDLEIK